MTYPTDAPDKPGRDVVFDKGFPRPGGFGKLVAAKLTPPNETPDHDFPFIPADRPSARTLAHRFDDAPRDSAGCDRADRDCGGVAAVRSPSLASVPAIGPALRRRRGSVELQSRQDDAVPDGVVFIPFAYVEAAANLLTGSALDPFGKNPRIQILRSEDWKRSRCARRRNSGSSASF